MSTEKFKISFTVYLVLRDDNKVLLLERQNTGYMDGYFSIVAGHVDGGETAEEAMAREAKEEVGIDVSPQDLKLIYVTHRLNDSPDNEYLSLFFECSNWQGTPENLEPEKCGRLLWADMTQLPDKVIESVRDVLTTYESGGNYKSYKTSDR